MRPNAVLNLRRSQLNRPCAKLGDPSTEKLDCSEGREGSFSAPITNSTASGDIRITELDIEVHGGGAGEVEVVVAMAESAPSSSDPEYLNASQPTSPKRPTMLRVERGSLGPEIEVRAWLEPCFNRTRKRWFYFVLCFYSIGIHLLNSDPKHHWHVSDSESGDSN
jgi:hypothetical protein